MTQIMPQKTSLLTGKWKLYPAYKDSGVEWLGEIPEHWEVKRLKFAAAFFGGGTPFKENLDYWSGGIPWVSPKDMKAEVIHDTEDHITQEAIENSSTRLVQAGAVLIVVRSGILSHSIPVAINVRPVAMNQDMKAVIPKSFLNAEYFALVVRGHQSALLVDWRKEGATVESIEFELLINTPCLIPPLDEQSAIVAYLDHETAKINALIAKKELLIELLQEKRVALISHAVTKGLDPTATMKDSGVEWLGEIPTHWEVNRMKFIAFEPLQYGANEPAELDDVNLPRYIRITDIDEDGSLREETFRSLPEDIAKPYLLRAGDLLFARSGATVGKTFMYRDSWGRACFAGYLIRMRINPLIAIPEFISYFTISSIYWNWLASVFSQATIQNVNAEKYSNLVITIPPLSEQHIIKEYLDHETTKIDALISKIREGIEKLREYSTALISAAVTGKIDVREEIAVKDDEDL